MTEDLTNQFVDDTFIGILHLDNYSPGITSSFQQVYDGNGTGCPLYIAAASIKVGTVSFYDDDRVSFSITVEPSSPASGQLYIYAKSDKKLYIKDSDGLETDLTAAGTTLADGDYGDVVLSSGGTVWTLDAGGTLANYALSSSLGTIASKNTGDYVATADLTVTTGASISGSNTGDQDLSAYAKTASISTVGLSNDYNDLDNLPSIPTQYTDELAQDAIGGILLATTSVTPTYDDVTPNISFAVNDEYVQDTVGAMVTGNTETLITVTYQDADGTIDFVVDSDLANYSNTNAKFVAAGDNVSDLTNDSGYLTSIPDSFLLNTGDVGTGAYDFGGATSLEIPNGTSPTVNVAGQIALDTDGDGTTIKSGVIKVYDGAQTVYAVMANNYPSSDNDVPAYDSATNRVVWQPQSGAGGGISNVVEDTTPQLGGQLDVNGQALGDGTLELITFTETASAVNQVNITNNATGSGPKVEAAGDDTNIDLVLDGKGSGAVKTLSSNLDVTGNIIVSGTVDGRDVATDGTKLDGIEALADVTDATNVDAAGAVMNSDTSTASMSFVIDEDNMASDSATKVPTQQSTKAYVDTGLATKQASDAELTAIAGLTSAANKIPMFSGSGTATVIDFLDEDAMTSNSATAVPSQQSVKAYVDASAVGITQAQATAYAMLWGL